MLPFPINISQESAIKEVLEQAGIYLTGSYPLCSPTSVFYNGATYVVGYKGDATNTSVIVQYKNGTANFMEVGTPTNGDTLQHQFPAVLEIGGLIYVFQVNGHGEDINVYKSNTENIMDGFTLHHAIPGYFGYVNPRLLDDGRVAIVSRKTKVGEPNLYGQMIAVSAVNDYQTWTVKELTDPDHSSTNHRHYPAAPFFSGSNSRFYGGINLRNSSTSPETFFGQAMWWTEDFSTFHNLSETFSKNVDIDGIITPAELEANFMIQGSTSADTTYTGAINAAIIDGIIYSSFFDASEQVWKHMKTVNGVSTVYPCLVPNMAITNANGISAIFIHDNGNNLILLVQEEKNGIRERNVYGCDYGFQNIQFLEQIDYANDTERIDRAVLPYNFRDIEGEYIIGGSSVPDIFPYLKTEDKFKI